MNGSPKSSLSLASTVLFPSNKFLPVSLSAPSWCPSGGTAHSQQLLLDTSLTSRGLQAPRAPGIPSSELSCKIRNHFLQIYSLYISA